MSFHGQMMHYVLVALQSNCNSRKNLIFTWCSCMHSHNKIVTTGLISDDFYCLGYTSRVMYSPGVGRGNRLKTLDYILPQFSSSKYTNISMTCAKEYFRHQLWRRLTYIHVTVDDNLLRPVFLGAKDWYLRSFTVQSLRKNKSDYALCLHVWVPQRKTVSIQVQQSDL